MKSIIFNSEMIRVILDDRKTHTRRVIKDQTKAEKYHYQPGFASLSNPYGQPGDRLWVRETLAYDPMDGKPKSIRDSFLYSATACKEDLYYTKSVASIHMPRWASRITLEVTDVRVERVQEISLNDINAEGIPLSKCWRREDVRIDLRTNFEDLWNSIYGKDAWDKNPYVWVVSFKRIKEQCQ